MPGSITATKSSRRQAYSRQHLTENEQEEQGLHQRLQQK
jgi:hypothetical protein